MRIAAAAVKILKSSRRRILTSHAAVRQESSTTVDSLFHLGAQMLGDLGCPATIGLLAPHKAEQEQKSMLVAAMESYYNGKPFTVLYPTAKEQQGLEECTAETEAKTIQSLRQRGAEVVVRSSLPVTEEDGGLHPCYVICLTKLLNDLEK